MKTSRNRQGPTVDEDAALVEFASVLSAGDRVRFAALGHAGRLSAAKQKSLLRQERSVVSRAGSESSASRRLRLRLETEKQFEFAVAVESQRTQVPTPQRSPDALTLHGRVVNLRRLAVPGLTVSALDPAGKAIVFSGSDDNGYFSLKVPPSPEGSDDSVTLLVSDRKKAVFYRGTECFPHVPGKVFYREIVIGAGEGKVPPTPPPDIDPQSVTTPDVRGFREDLAVTQLRAAGLVAEVSTRETEAEDAAGKVVEQDPKPGTSVAPCSTIAIVIGIPPAQIRVPSLVGLTLEAAKASLDKASLALGRIDPPDASARARVTQQSPAPGSSLAPGKPVDVVVEEPTETATVPDVLEDMLPAARKKLATAGLTLGQIAPPEISEKAIVSSQSPAKGAVVAKGTTVNLAMREPAAEATVPTVLRQTVAAARLTLAKVGLKPGKVTPSGAPENSPVIRQSPEAGSSAKPGSSVDLAVRPTTSEPTPAPEGLRAAKPPSRKKAREKK